MFIVLFGMPISCLTWDVALRFQHNGALAALVYSDAHGTSFISGSVNYRPFAHPRSDFQIPLVRVDRAILQFLNTPNEWMVTITPSSQPWLQFFSFNSMVECTGHLFRVRTAHFFFDRLLLVFGREQIVYLQFIN